MNRIELTSLNDYFKDIGSRSQKGYLFCRINNYSKEVESFIARFYDTARKNGVIIEGKIANPTEQNLGYMAEVIGQDFSLDESFLRNKLTKWLPRMNSYQNEQVAKALYNCLDALKSQGKNDNMLKNAYYKFMCWLYYKFERIVSRLGDEQLPKILYEGEISNYELLMLDVLASAGSDVLLLQYAGDNNYKKLDPDDSISQAVVVQNPQAFPNNFSLKTVREELKNQANLQQLYITPAEYRSCTNAWTSGKGFEDILKPVAERGNPNGFFYNAFFKIVGVEDKTTYQSELFRFKSSLDAGGREAIIFNTPVVAPTPAEISAINRQNPQNYMQAVSMLAANLKGICSDKLYKIVHNAFVDLMLELSKQEGMNVNKFVTKGVWLICLIRRYKQYMLVSDFNKMPCIIYLNNPNSNDRLFLKFVSMLPCDVLILCPDKSEPCDFDDPSMLRVEYEESLSLDEFPTRDVQIQVGTAAFHAERELDNIMYEDTGMYRNYQYQKMKTVNLRTTFEEISILWKEGLKFRQGFEIVDDTVNVPVIFAKVSGVKNGDSNEYWKNVKALMGEDTLVITKTPFLADNNSNPLINLATASFRNGKLNRDKIKNSNLYQYGFLKDATQELIFDKIESVVNSRLIKGTFENGMEFHIIASLLCLKNGLLRSIQGFDFTKKNPKVICINTTEKIISLEDSILYAFLNQIGFDIVFFVPTGYNCIEKYFNNIPIEEHQIGDYKYDMIIPNFNNVQGGEKSWFNKISNNINKLFGKGQ